MKTLDNFGKMGTPPTHPELLDWLAREFVRSGWSIKAMHRLMVTSADLPANFGRHVGDRSRAIPTMRCIRRMPLQRLDADQLYDTMLLVAGRARRDPFRPRRCGRRAPRRAGRAAPQRARLAAQHLRPAAAKDRRHGAGEL